MNAKAIAIISLAVVLIMAGIGLGCYVAGSKAGYEEAQKEYAINVSNVVEEARIEQERRNAEHLHQVAEYEKAQRDSDKKAMSLRQRLSAINTDKKHDCLCDIADSTNADVIELLNEATDNQALPDTTDQPFIAQDETATTEYMLLSIEQYNSCAIQLNALIDALPDTSPAPD